MQSLKLPSDDAIIEQGYLVARGVRALAILGECTAVQPTMNEVATRLERLLGDQHVIPFVANRGDGTADVGLAGSVWALDLYQWVTLDGVPPVQRHRIVGLLLGYSSTAIGAFGERAQGRRFTPGERAQGRRFRPRAGRPRRPAGRGARK